MNAKELYSTLKDMPTYEEFLKEFDISTLEGATVKKIADVIVERTEKYRKILEEYINPDGSSYAVIMEIKNFTESDKTVMGTLYKELVILERDYLLYEVEGKDYSPFISKAYSTWNLTKEKLALLLTKTKESWKESKHYTEKLGYLG